MTNPNDPMVPTVAVNSKGLTKREYFAAMAMQGFSANPGRNENSFAADAEASVKQADALISELNKEKP